MTDMSYKLGLDTGGTYTDAVVINESADILATTKSLTTHHDLSVGLQRSVQQVFDGMDNRARENVTLVSLSTTLATNALVEGKGRSVALILIGYTEKQFARARLNEALDGDPLIYVIGGHDAGGAEATPLDEAALLKFVADTKERVDAFAVSSMFAVRNPAHELRARHLIQTACDLPVTCGHELSAGLDAPRRALTAVLNGRLIPLIKGLITASRRILADAGINAPLMVVKGDGSLVTAEFAENTPVETILSGPAASIVGARFLARGEANLLVSDMGGTTTDIALLRDGQPQLDPNGATVGGWRTMVQAVMINTYGLGGDSAIEFDRVARDFTVGPRRIRPLSLLIHEHPHLMTVLEQQLEHWYTGTYAAQFVVANATLEDTTGFSATQKELWERIKKGPIALQQLFEDQSLERALNRLISRGYVIISGFTPSDASHVLGSLTAWSRDAAMAGAALLMRYSQYNLGPEFEDELAFASYCRHKVARLTAIALLETSLAEHNKLPGFTLPPGEAAFIHKAFATHDASPVGLDVQLKIPVAGIGAPAPVYYPEAGQLLNTKVLLPEHGDVANALGAVVGSVRQARSLTITPAGGHRVKVHAHDGPLEFDDLELAAAWSIEHLTELVAAQASSAGAVDCEFHTQRDDNVVDNNGERVFFESTITVQATGRPSTTVQG